MISTEKGMSDNVGNNTMKFIPRLVLNGGKVRDNCVACSVSSVADTRDRSLSCF